MQQNGSTTYTYDGENQLFKVSGSPIWTYNYNSDGQRVIKSNGTVGTRYWVGADGSNLAESDLAGTLTTEYIFFNGKRIARRDLPSGTVHYYFSDHLGSTSVVTDATGNVQKESDYYPYGGEITVSGSDPNHYKFTCAQTHYWG